MYWLYGLVIMLVAALELGAVAALVMALHRRAELPYALLTVGMITYLGGMMVQFTLLRAIDSGLLGLLPVQALLVGLGVGFIEEIARFLGFQYLARSAVTRAQALMIGAGHGLPFAVYSSLVIFAVGLSLLGGGDTPDNLDVVLGEALAGALSGWLPLVMHMALSWLVLQVFLRGALFWLFVSVFLHAVVEIMAQLLGTGEDWRVVAWRALVALVSLGLIRWLRPPQTA